ncbi:Uu.00g075350.m01.CDS01 [Anthostomella pinea]|uniref:Uu.00g075350.m01.CDS01 n=1 Tax=Anthostomella pinea TaxID=933095 RepID=A0AAI8VWJ3_9PEZI|nr:Uu.00g075350.m01.CDS01 [Anthostomella pinea]
MTGNGNRADAPPAVCDPGNVVLLADGTCGSTCTLFCYLLLFQLGIKATVIGGRPTTGPMQAIAGVEGAQIFYMPEISSLASAALILAAKDQQAELQAGNGKNAFSPSDSKMTLQFMMEPANC